jgi:hypothetical protein
MHRIEPARLKPGITNHNLPGPSAADSISAASPRTVVRGRALIFWAR